MTSARSGGRIVGLVAAAVALAACAAPSPPAVSTQGSAFTGPPVPPASAAPAPAADRPDIGYSTIDLVYLQQMVPHHQQALRMLDMVATHGASAEIAAAARVEQAAMPAELDQMSRALASLGVQPATDLVGGVHQHAGGMTEADVVRLGTLSGADFDRDFVVLLGKHVLGSVQLSRDEAEQGFNTPTRTLAAAIARRESDQVLALARLAG